ncbi:protein tramtrack, beta isoform-like [Schistocerca serialis cubense]|uniref:protein tramtrack, beta isoform-like n=1 Tax=Schistocerca serialis cubense TaxID=2023355 RepID=UPI00214F5C1A|nr:protein tramtrack, beta isoform-like [Schistocerca serialis cubense]
MMSVQWDKHETELLSHLFRYFSGEAFVDVTLWCSGCHFKAHRVMLSACSAYFEVSRRPALEKTPTRETRVLSQPAAGDTWHLGRGARLTNSEARPCMLQRVLLEHHSCGGKPVSVMLHGIEPENMYRLLELMYRGRTDVSASELPRLLETAASLGVRLLHSSTLRVCAAGADPLAAADASTAPPNGDVTQSAPQCDDQLTVHGV